MATATGRKAVFATSGHYSPLAATRQERPCS